MLIGVRGHDHGRGTAAQMAARIKDAGWECAQIAVQKLINGYNTLDDVDEKVMEEVREAFAAQDVATPILGFYIDPANKDAEIRAHQVALFKKGLTLSKLLTGAYVATETGGFSGSENERRPLFENVVDSVLRFAEHAERVGAVIAIEGGTMHTMGSIELMGELLRRVDSKRLQVVIDPVNLLRPEIVDSQPDYWQSAFDTFGSKISAFHVKDATFSDGRFHPCRLGDGIIDFDCIFGWMRQNKPDIPLFREEADPKNAGYEIAFMRKYAGL